jgi:hypothetical protein
MEQLDAHCLTEHKCSHLGCTAQCKNAAAVKEHIRNKHNTKCDVICQGEFYLVDLLSLNHIFFMAGQRYQINRDTASTNFNCPICPFTTNATRDIQKHCKDHSLGSVVRRTSNRYHPYGSTNSIQDPPVEISEDVIMIEVANRKESSQVDPTNNPGMLYAPH